jgi:hypothetical protein
METLFPYLDLVLLELNPEKQDKAETPELEQLIQYISNSVILSGCKVYSMFYWKEIIIFRIL